MLEPSMVRRPPSFPASWVAAALFAALPACGGGGGGGASEPIVPAELTLDMGRVSSTAPTRRTVTVGNDRAVTVTATSPAGAPPFTFDSADLPALIPAHGRADLGVVFTPTGAGPAAGDATVLLDDGAGDVRQVVVHATADAEPVALSTSPSAIAFGEVLEGQVRTITLHVRNDSTATAVPVTTASLPSGGFTIVGTPLPTTIAPGTEAAIDVRYAPSAVGAYGGSLVLRGWDAGASLVVPVSSTTGGAVVTDYGAKTLDGAARTPTLTVDVPSDAISLSLEGVMTPGSVGGLAELVGPSGKVYENTSSTGAFVWIPGDGVFSPTLPNTDQANLQLEPGGGTYSFRLYRLSGTASTMSVRAIVERRPGHTGTVGSLDLDVWLAKVISAKAATAATDARLQAILSTIDSILAQSGVRLGDVRYHDVTDATYDDVTDPEFGPMLKLTSAESDPRLNLFFVRTALGGGVLGVSATLAGPRRNGTELSGVMSLYDGGYSSSFIGLVAAHEIGHFLGLYHTVEQDGSHDFVDDTAECPSSGANAACPTAGGGYLMHWQAVGGTTITPGQSGVILGHPCVAADVPVPAAFRAAMFSRRAAADAAGLLEGRGAAWCGTCSRCRPKGR